MSGFVLAGDSSGAITLQASSVAGTNTITLPAETGTVLTTANTRILTTSNTQLAVKSDVIGVGQTWQNVTSSRALGVNYTNSTGRPIMVMVHCTGNSPNGMGFIITVDGVIAAEGRSPESGYGPGLSVIVPPGATYSSTINLYAGALSRWTELR